jgi:hypothetical protein
MGVTDGQPVNAATTNPAFLDANNDDTALGKINFNNISDPTVSGPEILNIQREANAAASFMGKPINVAYNSLPGWSHNEVGGASDNIFFRTDAITGLFNGTTGHMHTGVDGDGPLLTGASITGNPLQGFFEEGVDLSAVTGSSSDVSSQLAAKVASAGSASLGVVVTTPYNKLVLRYASGANENDQIEDGSGHIVYGRLTNSGSTWTINYFTDLSGVETPFSFASATDVRWYYQELFNTLISSPVYSQLAVIPSDNATADVIDATETAAGKVLLSNVVATEIGSISVKGISPRVSHDDHAHKGVHSVMIDGDPTQAFGDTVFQPGSGILLSWVAGKLNIAQSVTNTPQVEFRTVTSGEATAKSLTLSATPNAPTHVIVDVIGVGPQFYGLDYTVSGATLSWNGLGMDALPIETGDNIRLIYWS